MVKEFALDGIAIDWEYPTSSMASISSSPDLSLIHLYIGVVDTGEGVVVRVFQQRGRTDGKGRLHHVEEGEEAVSYTHLVPRMGRNSIVRHGPSDVSGP